MTLNLQKPQELITFEVLMNTQLFSRRFAKIIPSPPLRVSSYAILTRAEKANKYIVSHGCSGALMLINKNCYDWLISGAKHVKNSSQTMKS